MTHIWKWSSVLFANFILSSVALAGQTILNDITGVETRVSPCDLSSDRIVVGSKKSVKNRNTTQNSFFDWSPERERWFRLSNGECIHLPMWFENSTSLQMQMLAPIEAINQHLKEHGVTAVPTLETPFSVPGDKPGSYKFYANLNPTDNIQDSDLEETTLVTLVSNDFARTSIGHIAPSFLFVWVKDTSKTCYLNAEKCSLPKMFFLDYYVSSKRAELSGEETWGMKKDIGYGDFDFYSDPFVKTLKYRDVYTGKYVHNLKWTRHPATPTLTGTNSEDVFDLELLGITGKTSPRLGPGQTYNLMRWGVKKFTQQLFNKETDLVDISLESDFGKPLRAITFKPFLWNYLEGMRVIYYTDQPPEAIH